jgi:BirA family biotin operon repressor/biotin-[acetyl-CoA-carboxylase] ligase
MIDWDVIHRDVVASTMEEIDALGESGAPSGTVVVANEQTSGRGRAGRAWTAPAGSGLFLSMLYRPDLTAAELSSLPLHVGVAVAEAIETASGVDCQLKWPNDVLVEGKKIAGILVTSRLRGERIRFANIGIGINCLTARDELPPEAASIWTAGGQTVAPNDLLPLVLDHLGARLAAFEARGGRTPLSDWWIRAAFRGAEVRVTDAGAEKVGILSGIGDDGALLLTNEQGEIMRIVSGDLTRGPRRV